MTDSDQNTENIKGSGNSLNYLIYFLMLLTLVLFGGIALYRWPFADDFGFITRLREGGVLEFAWHSYKTQDARFIMPLFLLSLTVFKYLGFTGSMIVASLNYLISAYLAIRILNYKCGWKLSRLEYAVMTLVFNFLIWFLSYDYLGTTLYWMTATSYNLAIAAGLGWIYYYYTRTNHQFGAGFLASTFILASTAQMVSIPIFTIVFLDYLLGVKLDKKQRKKLLYLAVFIFVVICFSTVSPGSFKQYKLMHLDSYYAASGGSKMLMYLRHFIDFNLDSLSGRTGLFVLFSFFIFISVYALKNHSAGKLRIDLTALARPENYKYILVAFSSLIIYWPTFLTGGRYYQSFTYLMFIALVILISKTVSVTALYRNVLLNRVLLVVIFGAMAFFYGRVFYQSRIIHEFMVKRENVLRSSADKSVMLDAVDFSSVTRAARSYEIESDASYYVNRNVADYYGKDSVKVRNLLSLKEIKELNKITK